MQLTLYEETYGYYSHPHCGRIGRKGDFFTSVSVGDTFGMILSYRIEREWEEQFGKPATFAIVEQGAHDGQLARDILNALERRGSPLSSRISYSIVEPREPMRRHLIDSLASDGRIEVKDSFSSAQAKQGIFLCNELLDAFPVRCAVFREGLWNERCVRKSETGEGLAWTEKPSSMFELDTSILPTESLPEGFRTEVCPVVKDWIQEASSLFEQGQWWIIDYGYEADDYFSLARADGTLRCYRTHESSDNPFESVGDTDMTAHVNFTQLQDWAGNAGLHLLHFTDQHHFLIDSAKPWLLSMEGKPPEGDDAARLRQFQTLTHPGMMGRNFKVATYGKG